MISECQEHEKISLLQASAWINHENAVARELLKRLNTHEQTCPICQAVQNGVGLAGGLFAGAKIAGEA